MPFWPDGGVCDFVPLGEGSILTLYPEGSVDEELNGRSRGTSNGTVVDDLRELSCGPEGGRESLNGDEVDDRALARLTTED